MQANRFGIIGSGAIGLEHIRNICATPGAEVTMVADTTAQVRRPLRAPCVSLCIVVRVCVAQVLQ